MKWYLIMRDLGEEANEQFHYRIVDCESSELAWEFYESHDEHSDMQCWVMNKNEFFSFTAMVSKIERKNKVTNYLDEVGREIKRLEDV